MAWMVKVLAVQALQPDFHVSGPHKGGVETAPQSCPLTRVVPWHASTSCMHVYTR